jgi:peptide/nickel transport system substrate-binding protein
VRSRFRHTGTTPFRLGVLALCVLPLLLAACGGGTSPTNTPAAATKAAATPTAVGDKHKRGGFRLNVHQASSGNGKDQQAACIVTEPLAVTSANALTPDAPVLVKEIPSVQDGELAPDDTSVTWRLKNGVKWSESTPFTSADVLATYRYATNPVSASAGITSYSNMPQATRRTR